MFDEEKEKLEKIFGDLAIAIEHIGSTSVEGLSSKPIIDIAVGVKNLKDFEKVRKFFEKMSFSIKDNSDCDEILIRKGLEDDRTHFIHVMEIESKRFKETILFRDYLRNHYDMLKKYENLKKELALKYSNDRKNYTSSKKNY